jgi:hypothetical protein
VGNWSWPMEKVVQHVQMKPHAKFEHFWTWARKCIWIFKFERFLNNWKTITIGIGSDPYLQYRLVSKCDRTSAFWLWPRWRLQTATVPPSTGLPRCPPFPPQYHVRRDLTNSRVDMSGCIWCSDVLITLTLLIFVAFCLLHASYHIGSNPVGLESTPSFTEANFALSLSTKASNVHAPCIEFCFTILTFMFFLVHLSIGV